MTLISLLLTILLPSQQPLIEWNEYYRISWEDFRGQPGANSIGDAGAVVQIKAKPFLVRNEVHYNVVAYFSRPRSWARDTSDALLRHEQLHFDLAELYARKIRKRIDELKKSGVTDVKDINAAIQILLDESNDADRRYDVETLHGALVKKQKEWERRISRELRELNEFRKKKRVVPSK